MRSASSPDLLDRSPQTSIAPWQASFSTPSKGSAEPQTPCCAASRCAQRAQGSQDSREATTARMSPRLMSAAPLNTSQIDLSSCSPILDQRLQLHGTPKRNSRYEDGDLLHFPARELDTYRNYYVHMQNCAPPSERAQEHGNVLFTGFTPVPNTYAATGRRLQFP